MKDTELYTKILGLKRPWRVCKVELNLDQNRVDVWAEEETRWDWKCPVCNKPAPVYDHTEEQTWRHLDTCEYETHLHARLVRINCNEHGVKQVPAQWAGPRSMFTLKMEIRLIDLLKECDVNGVTRLMGTKWDATWNVLDRAVARGLERKQRRVPQRIGVDEKAIKKGHNYESIVCDLDSGTVEYIVDDRKQKSLEEYFRQFTREELSQINAIALDMWDPYIAATREFVPDAGDKMVFDRYHITKQLTTAVDKVRRREHKLLSRLGDQRLKGTKYLWIWNEENIPVWRRTEFDAIKKTNLKTGRAWAIKESLRRFWNYVSPAWALKYFKVWYFWATHSRLKPIIAAAKTLKRHLTNIMTYFKHRITNATAEGINSKIQTIKLMACGYRNRERYRKVIYFHCGGLDLYPRMEAA